MLMTTDLLLHMKSSELMTPCDPMPESLLLLGVFFLTQKKEGGREKKGVRTRGRSEKKKNSKKNS